MSDRILVAGIGADGWPGLPVATQEAITACEVLFGSQRQLDLVPPTDALRVSWPSPLLPELPGLFAAHDDRRIGVLASGDPMFHGIGVTLARLFGPERLHVLSQPSSASLACARLGWPLASTPVLSMVARPVETVLPTIVDGARVLVLSNDAGSPAALAGLLADNGFGGSTMRVLAQLGGRAERIHTGTAAQWPDEPVDPLNVVAIDVRADPGTPRLTRLPGLPDTTYGGDGQLTKAEIRALSLCALAPAPGELLWDVGGGSGSIAIEWSRTHPDCRAIAFEHRDDRAETIVANARILGVPTIQVRGRAPDAFADAPDPDAVFVGGGVTVEGLLDACWQRLRPGGRLVANAVTVESEAVVVAWAQRHNGSLRRLQVQRAEPLGGFTAWRPHLPVVQAYADKPSLPDNGRAPESGTGIHPTQEDL
ncbi:precorrin-6y C5,15-methyltransferase (decarboxylating) subunit CbiE [Aldersonia sp. NBC_00410]|uniref:precorrin-6y C5,15-methyltransferase (decarboxylating) subunit CbiE n=1 Tax=Aldersonia sp. NBC_00410 TaxID=2975954 RepID=UPI0022565BC3|nr:precorrin-6y C5,15-methyltransferase (decarboxylating) subunit CbiE [Aldersonia sp. NBC_00410]MCX5045817.1 precorrin-6y C5,15-methyltransferase (decarboxylating) subunit CbiE [Aldersonia sp. NBC_00410]